jgi:hypothetical protein
MRVLILVLLVGCYDPGVEDCQYRCGGGMLCPDGSDCRGGFCRTTDAVQCANDPCANTPEPPPNCSNKFPLLDADGCAVVCTPLRQHDEVQFECSPDWRAGILDSRSELDAVPITTGRFWVGAERVGMQFQWFSGAPVDPAGWDMNFPSLAGSSCVYLEGTRRRLRNDRSCDEDQTYICSYPPTN